jgi:hypothetical protein
MTQLVVRGGKLLVGSDGKLTTNANCCCNCVPNSRNPTVVSGGGYSGTVTSGTPSICSFSACFRKIDPYVEVWRLDRELPWPTHELSPSTFTRTRPKCLGQTLNPYVAVVRNRERTHYRVFEGIATTGTVTVARNTGVLPWTMNISATLTTRIFLHAHFAVTTDRQWRRFYDDFPSNGTCSSVTYTTEATTEAWMNFNTPIDIAGKTYETPVFPTSTGCGMPSAAAGPANGRDYNLFSGGCIPYAFANAVGCCDNVTETDIQTFFPASAAANFARHAQQASGTFNGYNTGPASPCGLSYTIPSALSNVTNSTPATGRRNALTPPAGGLAFVNAFDYQTCVYSGSQPFNDWMVVSPITLTRTSDSRTTNQPIPTLSYTIQTFLDDTFSQYSSNSGAHFIDLPTNVVGLPSTLDLTFSRP